MNEYHLFIDELGTPIPNDGVSDFYILCGCAVPEMKREWLKVRSDQIKFKYWGRTDFSFHSREIGLNMGEFEIFANDRKRKNEFYKDLFKFLRDSQIIVFSVLVEKESASDKGWDEVKVIKSTAYYLIQNFISLVISNPKAKGKIIIESSYAEKDRFYLDAFTYFLSPKNLEFPQNYKEIQKQITSLSFVSKHNLDIEEQLADLFAYGIKCKYEKEFKMKTFEKESYESAIINIVNAKSFKSPKKIDPSRMEYLKNINSFLLLP